MFLKVCVFVALFCFSIKHVDSEQTHHIQKRFVMNGIKEFLKTKSNDLIVQQNGTYFSHTPTDVFEHLNRMKTTIIRHGKKATHFEKITTQRTVNDTINEFDNYVQEILYDKPIKLQRRLRNCTRQLRHITFNTGEKYLKHCTQTYNKLILYSIESTLNTIAAEKNKKILFDVENIVTCTKSFELNPIVMTNIYDLSNNCRDTALATISSVILNAHETLLRANETTTKAIEVLRNCSKDYKNNELIQCIEENSIKLHNLIIDIGTKVLQKSIEGSQMIVEQGTLFTKCMNELTPKIDTYLRNEHDFNMTTSCAPFLMTYENYLT